MAVKTERESSADHYVNKEIGLLEPNTLLFVNMLVLPAILVER